MGRLVDRFTGDGRTTGAMRDTFIGPEAPARGSAAGIMIDGVTYALAGQAPLQHGGSWGDMSWVFWRRLYGHRSL